MLSTGEIKAKRCEIELDGMKQCLDYYGTMLKYFYVPVF